MFSISGARIAERGELPELIVIMMSVITGTFGGVLRDVLCNEIPMILQRGRIYASAVVAGATLVAIVTLSSAGVAGVGGGARSEEHTSELQSLMRISYAVFCLKKKKQQHSTQL